MSSSAATSPQQHTIRPAAVAGVFYPADAKKLVRDVHELLNHSHIEPSVNRARAIIAPHAGYVYSGAQAAKSYAWFANALRAAATVIVLGPAHRVAFYGMAVPSANLFATPMGDMPVDEAKKQRALTLSTVSEQDLPHHQEHALEVQLPFLQAINPALNILPVVIGHCVPQSVCELMTTLDSPDTVFVISSDLTHFLDYETAQVIDGQTALAIEQFADDKISHEQACGATGICGLLRWAQRQHLRCQALGRCNSGDCTDTSARSHAGDRTRVVGYGSWGFYAD